MTRKRHLTSALTALAVGSSALVAATVPAQAQAAEGPLGKTSLAKVLAADGAGFDKNSRDFDILDNAVRAVLAEKPKSPVSVLAKGRVKLTAFAPIDGAFRRLVLDVTGEHYRSEKRVFTELAAAADIDTIESVLLYHVVPGAVITSKAARHSDGAKLTTALEDGTVRVNVRAGRTGVPRGCGHERREPASDPQAQEPQQGEPADRPRHQPGAATARPLSPAHTGKQRAPT